MYVHQSGGVITKIPIAQIDSIVFYAVPSPVTLPTVTTAAASQIDSTTAISGGNVTNDGGTAVTVRGVCWSTHTSPSISDSLTADGGGLGGFISNLTSLTPSTLYYVRAYATNSAGTAYGNEISFNTASAQLSIGDSYSGGVIAYFLQAGDTGYIAGETHGLIAAPNDQSMSKAWGCSDTLIGATSTALGTGQANTTAIVNGCLSINCAARLCNDLVLNGYSDWYLPSKDELNKLHENQTQIGGFGNNYPYWNSSEFNAGSAWSQYFPSGDQGPDYKAAGIHVRCIRSF